MFDAAIERGGGVRAKRGGWLFGKQRHHHGGQLHRRKCNHRFDFQLCFYGMPGRDKFACEYVDGAWGEHRKRQRESMRLHLRRPLQRFRLDDLLDIGRRLPVYLR